MLRTITTCEKNVTPLVANVLTIAATTDTLITPDYTNMADEIAAISIQNIGANPVYFTLGQDCDGAKSIHGALAQWGQFVNPTTKSINVYSPLGTTIAVLVLRRDQGL